ncbi:MAG: winged helix-turn-helix domain-containing protein [Pyrinomonadaceae bacterium]
MTYSFLDLAFDVLKLASQPMIYQEIWQVGQESGLTTKLSTAGKTPWQSLGARLYVEVRDNEHSKFVKVGSRPTRFS